jgi:hypothetical protein
LAIRILTKELGFVAGADLAHLDSCLVFACKFLNELAKIDPAIRHKVKDDAFAAKYVLGVNYFHRQIQLFDEPEAVFHLFLGDFLKVPLLTNILGGCVSDEFASWAPGVINLTVLEIFFNLVRP